MNQMGLGMTFEARDLATGIMGRVANSWMDIEGKSSRAALSMKASLKEFGLGMGIMGAGLLGLSSLNAPIESAKKFEAAIAEVTTETDAASLSYDRLYDMGIELSQQFGKLPVEEAKGLYQAVAAGANNATKATALMTTANKLAIGGITTVETAIDGLTTALNAYGMAFTDQNIQGVSDAFFVAMRDGKTKVADLASQIGRVAPSAAALGISFDQVLASISAMTGSGLKADMAITGLHGALANIVKPSSDATAEAARLGIKFDQTSLRAKGWKGFLDQITTSAGYNANSLSKLFTSVEGLNAIQALTANGSEKFNSILADMGNKSGATQNAFDKMADTLEFSQDKMAALKEVASILIGDALLPLAKGALRIGSAVLDGFNKIPAPIRNFMVQMFAAGSAVMAVVGGVLALKAAFAIGAAGASALGITFTGVLATLTPVLVVIGLATLAFYAFKEAYESNLGGFGTFVKDAASKAMLAFQAIGQLFSQGGFSGDVLKGLNAGNAGVKDFAINVYVWINRIKGYLAGIAEGFSEGIAKAKPTFEAFMGALEKLAGAFGFVSDAVDPLANQGKLDEAGQSGKNMGLELARLAENVIQVATAFIDITADIVKFIGAIGGAQTLLNLFATYVVVKGLLAVVPAALSAAGSLAGLATATVLAAAPWLALAAAIGGVVAALYQAVKLLQEWDSQSSSQVWNQFKHDVGISSDAEYEAAMNKRTGLVTGGDYGKQAGAEDYDARQSLLEQDRHLNSAEKANQWRGPTMANLVPPQALPAGAQGDASGNAAADLASAAKAFAGKPPPVTVVGTVILDSGELVGKISSMQTSDASRAGDQTSVPD